MLDLNQIVIVTGGATTVISVIITLATAYLRAFMAGRIAELELHLSAKLREEFAGKENIDIQLEEVQRRLQVQESMAIGTGGRVDKLEVRVTEHGHQISNLKQTVMMLPDAGGEKRR
jgi:hypothetical protein